MPEVKTSELAAALGVSRQTVHTWVARGLLPRPRRLHLGAHGTSSRFPQFSIALGQYVRQALRESPYGDVARMLAPLLAQDPEQINGELASGKTIAALIGEFVGTR